MEAGVFPRQVVVDELVRFVRVEMVTDRQTEQSRKNREILAKRFKDVTLPLYVILDPDGNELRRLIGYTRKVEDFVSFLRGTKPAD